MLTAATRLFNRHSFAAVTLEAIADEGGMTRGALYHHFESKEALVFECFNRGLCLYRREIEQAREPGLDGLEIVRRFIRNRLKPGEPRMIIFSDIDALPKVHRAAIHAARAANVELLRGVIAAGIADGSIARRDPLLTSVGLFSVLDWMPAWYSESSYYSRQQAAEAIDDILTHGVLRRDVTAPDAFPAPHDFGPLMDRLAIDDRCATKRDRLLRIATQSFNLRGVVGSSLEHIAREAGVSRGAYYYHARDKTALLHHCLVRAYRTESILLEHIVAEAAAIDDAVDKAVFEEIEILRLVMVLDASDHGPKISFQNVPFLSAEQRAEIDSLDAVLVGRNRARYASAIASGAMRDLDTWFVQQIGAGLRNTMPLWAPLTAAYRSEVVADSHSNLFLYGLKPRG